MFGPSFDVLRIMLDIESTLRNLLVPSLRRIEFYIERLEERLQSLYEKSKAKDRWNILRPLYHMDRIKFYIEKLEERLQSLYEESKAQDRFNVFGNPCHMDGIHFYIERLEERLQSLYEESKAEDRWNIFGPRFCIDLSMFCIEMLDERLESIYEESKAEDRWNIFGRRFYIELSVFCIERLEERLQSLYEESKAEDRRNIFGPRFCIDLSMFCIERLEERQQSLLKKTKAQDKLNMSGDFFDMSINKLHTEKQPREEIGIAKKMSRDKILDLHMAFEEKRRVRLVGLITDKRDLGASSVETSYRIQRHNEKQPTEVTKIYRRIPDDKAHVLHEKHEGQRRHWIDVVEEKWYRTQVIWIDGLAVHVQRNLFNAREFDLERKGNPMLTTQTILPEIKCLFIDQPYGKNQSESEIVKRFMKNKSPNITIRVCALEADIYLPCELATLKGTINETFGGTLCLEGYIPLTKIIYFENVSAQYGQPTYVVEKTERNAENGIARKKNRSELQLLKDKNAILEKEIDILLMSFLMSVQSAIGRKRQGLSVRCRVKGSP